ncbi:thiol:disulfide interchange protein DsbA/DsbL [Solimicrobium silvestre]|uniref:Thiol:disulfide interchange protein DsbA n=1 Tax=Solimicrobium silvestre TaxID=2099400 RepID=A0A2S9GZR6_9BURK|nr:thiol:disulfide interchange protein DsbA/DsbL [Solimicrobium silvestre]PRC93207.1 Thioredoxin [Solimicrobium silvestre]
MRAISFVCTSFLFIANLALATPTMPINGAEYTTLATPQPVTSIGKKIEVIEFFMYHCPACNTLEPALLDWVKKQGANVEFKRIHVPHNGLNDAEAHLFLTLEAMKLEDTMHSKVLNTWHVEHHQLLRDEDNLEWAVKNGLDKEKFLGFYNSFSVISKLHNLKNVMANYHVDSTPTIVVDGRYLTSMASVDESNKDLEHVALDKATLQVVDALVAQARASK